MYINVYKLIYCNYTCEIGAFSKWLVKVGIVDFHELSWVLMEIVQVDIFASTYLIDDPFPYKFFIILTLNMRMFCP